MNVRRFQRDNKMFNGIKRVSGRVQTPSTRVPRGNDEHVTGRTDMNFFDFFPF